MRRPPAAIGTPLPLVGLGVALAGLLFAELAVFVVCTLATVVG